MRVRTLAAATAGAALMLGSTASAAAHGRSGDHRDHGGQPKLPISAMEQIIGADGQVSDGVLTIDINRDDLHANGPDGTPFKTGFQLRHELAFQSVGSDKAVLNGDLALAPSETQKVMNALDAQHLHLQAFHQHLYDMSPMVWFIHFRGLGGPKTLAREIRNVIDRTATKLPQSSPPNPTTPLPVKTLERVLGGSATVGENGVVTVAVPRRHGVLLGGVPVSPDLNIATTIQFEPVSGGRAAVVPDFSMTAPEIDRVESIMHGFGWDTGCLYNQETAEYPQLYFAHQYKVGDAVTLAEQIRRGLNATDAQH